jgi:hypothetical protein
MRALKWILAGGAGIAALAVSAPASAQYYPGYGGYSPYGGNVVGQVLGQIFGGYGYNGYGVDSRAMVDRCAAAVTDRINRQYGGYAGYGGGYGYAQPYGGARVVQITSVERKSGSKLRIRGIAQTNMGAGYGGYGYNQGYGGGEVAFKCNIDYRGYISDIDLDRIDNRYGYSGYGGGYAPYGNYRRY